jgi:hypothetical protein
VDSLFVEWNSFACRVWIVGAKAAKCMMCFLFFVFFFQTLSPLTSKWHILFIPYLVHWIFATLEGWVEGYKYSLSSQSKGKMFGDLTSKPLGGRHNDL